MVQSLEGWLTRAELWHFPNPVGKSAPFRLLTTCFVLSSSSKSITITECMTLVFFREINSFVVSRDVLPSKPASDIFLALVKYQSIRDVCRWHDACSKSSWMRESCTPMQITSLGPTPILMEDGRYIPEQRIPRSPYIYKGVPVKYIDLIFRPGPLTSFKFRISPPRTLKNANIRSTTVQFA